MNPKVITRRAWARVAQSCPQKLEFRVVTRSDAWLAATYRLMRANFERDVLDPVETYEESLKLNRKKNNPFPLLMVAAFLREGNAAHIVGLISGSLMRLERSGPARRKNEKAVFFYAIGHQATAGILREKKVRGIGQRLWDAAHKVAAQWAAEMGGTLDYTVLEAEPESIGFWDRMGCRWPRGVQYWQPPLEFKANGDFIEPEVPEILMIKPWRPGESIGRQQVTDIIRTIYLDWSLFHWRGILGKEAMARAEAYVMDEVFGSIRRLMPPDDPIELVRRSPEDPAPWEGAAGRPSGGVLVQPEIYISYAWCTGEKGGAHQKQKEPGPRREQIVRLMCEAVRAAGRPVCRKNPRQIAQARRVIAVIDAAWLKSEACLAEEMFRVYRDCGGRGEAFAEKVIPVVLDEARRVLDSYAAIRKLARTWETTCPGVGEMLAALRDITPRHDFNQMIANGFHEIIDRLPPAAD